MSRSGCIDARLVAHTVAVAVLLIGVCACCAADSPQPVVGVDEFHLNLLMLNPAAMFRMTMLRDELVAGGYSVQQINSPITPAALAGFAALIVTTPSDYYDYTELNAVKGFATAGGGVFFCANYGIDNGLPTLWAPICQEFANSLGFTLDNNTATDSTHNASGYDRWVTFGGPCIAAHPVTGGVGVLQSFSTTTLVPSANVTTIVSTDSDAVPPLRPAVQVRDYGAGRVVLSGSPLYLADVVPDRDIGGGRKADMTGLTAAGNRRFAYNAITWLAGAAGRPLVTVSLSASIGVPGDVIDVNGTVCDANLTGYVLEYRLASGTGAWTQIGSVHTSSVVGAKLGEWNLAGVPPGDYTLRVTASNGAGGSYSVSHLVHVAYALARISDLAGTPNGTYVKLTDKEVAAGSDDLIGRIYLEESDRCSGICVLTAASALRGTLATVTGVHNVSGAAHTISAAAVTTRPKPSGGPLGPVGVVNRAVGGSSAGASTTALLVRTWGRVLGSDSNGFRITDGSPSELQVLTGYARVSIPAPAVGSTVAVVGAGASYQGGPAVVARQGAQVLALP